MRGAHLHHPLGTSQVQASAPDSHLLKGLGSNRISGVLGAHLDHPEPRPHQGRTRGTWALWYHCTCEIVSYLLIYPIIAPFCKPDVNCLFQGVTCICKLFVHMYGGCATLCTIASMCVWLLLIHDVWMVSNLWQTLVPTCMNACPHLNKPEFQPLSQVLFVCGALGSWSPLWRQINLQSGPVHEHSPQ